MPKRIKERVNGQVNVQNQEELRRASVTLAERINFLSALAAKHPDDAAKSSAPTSADDASQGYYVGCLWVDESTDTAYICVDDTLSSAVWKQIT